MGSLLLRSKASAAGSSLLRRISAEIFRSPYFFDNKLGARMMSSVNSADDESPLSWTLPSRISPWLTLSPAFEGGQMVYNFYSLVEDRVVSLKKRGGGGGEKESVEMPDDDALLVGSSHGWLALFNQRNNDLFLSNPLTRRQIKLPPIHTLPIPEENLKHGQWCVSKVVISCSPDEEECRAMMSFGPENRLAFCWPGHSTEWTPIGTVYGEALEGKFVRRYEDFVYSTTRKLFFCITEYKDFEAWDLRDPHSPRLDWSDWSFWLSCPIKNFWLDEGEEDVRLPKYLVFGEEANQLFYVQRRIMARIGPNGSHVKSIYFGKYSGWDDSYPYKTIGFNVYKIDREGGDQTDNWRHTNTNDPLDGLAMFIGVNHSFAIPAAEYPELKLKPNCIYFTDDKELTPPRWVDRTLYNYGGHDIGIFDCQTKTFSPCYYPSDVQTIKRITPPPLWFTPSSH